MSRPKPTVILEHVDHNFKSDQVLKAECIYAVFYEGKPINLRTIDLIVKGPKAPTPKYKKVSFSNPGHALNLAQKLNTLFKTNKFTVFALTSGHEISE